MKKNYFILSAFTIALSVLVGCSTPEQSNTGEAQNEQQVETQEPKENQETQETSSVVTPEEYVSQIKEMVDKNWPYMKDVWPNLDYTQHNVVVFYRDEEMNIKKVWLVNTETKKELQPSEYEGVEIPRSGGFGKIDFLGKPSIALVFDDYSLEEDKGKEMIDNSMYALATHELVHFYYQSDISLPEDEGGGRAQEYPIDYTPRLYRGMIYRNLCSAIEETDEKTTQEYIQKATYWFNKWKNEYSDEVDYIRGNDMFEGHAQYIDIIGKFADDTENLENIKKYLDVDKIHTAVDRESYDLGYSAGVLLSRVQPEWKETFMTANKSPIELLLSDVIEIQDEVDADYEEKLKAEVNSTNSEIEGYISNIIEAEENKEIPYLKIGFEYLTGSIQSNGFFKYKDYEIMSQLYATLQKDANQVQVNGLSIVSTVDGDILIPLSEEFTVEGNLITFDSEHLKGSMELSNTENIDGRVWYVVE